MIPTTVSWQPFGRTSVMALWLLVGLPVAAFAAADSVATPTVADTIRALESARGEALMTADTTALSNMTADEFIEVNRLGQLRTKAENVHDIASGELKLVSVKYDSQTVRNYGDVAILTGIADNTGTFKGFPFKGRIRYTRIFVRRDGRWQAVGMQHTPMQ